MQELNQITLNFAISFFKSFDTASLTLVHSCISSMLEVYPDAVSEEHSTQVSYISMLERTLSTEPENASTRFFSSSIVSEISTILLPT